MKLNLLLAACACLSCAPSSLGFTTWEDQNCSLVGDFSLTSPTQGAQARWVGCRAGYFPGVAGSTDVFELELLTAGSSGSFASPAPGWLAIALSGSQAPGNVRVSPHSGGAAPATMPAGAASVVFYTQSGEQVYGTGSMNLSAFSRDAQSLDFEAEFAVQFAATGGDTYSLSGSAHSTWAPPAPAVSSSGPSGCADNGASCTSDPNVTHWKSQCGSYAIGPCHCEAAATYKCFYAHGCYKEAGAPTSTTGATLKSGCSSELASAIQTNTQCGFSCP